MTVYIGIDWSEKKHDLCFLNQVGEVLQTLTIARTPAGFLELEQARRRLGVPVEECVVGIETHHNPLIDFLIERGYTRLYVLPPNAVKSARGRYWQSGSKSDLQDAHLIADMLRTDQAKYHAWVPDWALDPSDPGQDQSHWFSQQGDLAGRQPPAGSLGALLPDRLGDLQQPG